MITAYLLSMPVCCDVISQGVDGRRSPRVSDSYIILLFWHESGISMTWRFLKWVSSSFAHLDLVLTQSCRHEKEKKGKAVL